MELRAGFAADLLAQGHSCTVVTTRVTEEYKLSRRQARRITAKAMDKETMTLCIVDRALKSPHVS